MRLRFAWLVSLLCAPVACSSSDFQVAEGVDSGVTDTGGTTVDTGTVTVTDSGSEETTAGDAGGCEPLPGNPDTIYVDARATGAPIGTAACPVKSIREGLAIVAGLASAKRTVKVAGGTASAPLVYTESSALVVKAQTSVVGDGPERVTVTGGGPCGAAQCVFVLEGQTTLEGVTVIAGDKTGISMTPGAFTYATARRTTVTGAKGNTNHAVVVKGGGGADLGPAFRAEKNQAAGVSVEDIFSLHVIATGTTPNAFSDNAGGILMQKGVLNFDGGEVSRNAAAGIALLSTPKHSIVDLVARDNGGPGVYMEAGAGLKLRTSTLLKNRVGLVVRFGLSVDIDLGSGLDAGKNLFGGAGEKNNRAAICFATAKNTKVPASGNKFSACPPTTMVLADGATCESPPSGYSDVLYALFGTDPIPPIDTGACTVGP